MKLQRLSDVLQSLIHAVAEAVAAWEGRGIGMVLLTIWFD